MKQFFIVVLVIIAVNFLQAQNVGIGTADPLNRLHISGNMLVNTPTRSTSTAPTPAQTTTMMNGINLSIGTDSTGRIYDPGGPSGNYTSNLTSYITIPFGFTCIGIELTVESMQLGTGDSLLIEETQNSTERLLAVGNGYTSTGKMVFNSTGLFLTFKSNGDVNVGSGFSILFRRIYDISSTLPNLDGVIGKAFFFNTKNGALRSGLINNSGVGDYSTAMGYSTTASGDEAIAAGRNSVASGSASFASGYFTNAIGNNSMAIGASTDAVGTYSTAMGVSTTANGTASTAIGENTAANGDYSLAMGSNTISSGRFSTAMGTETIAAGYAGTVVGMYNKALLLSPQNTVTSGTPLFIVGNGSFNNLSNAMAVLKNGNVGIGSDAPAANLHIKHGSGGGLILENETDNNKWRIYSASGDNNLTFYNNAGNEIADIDDATGTFNALSDRRYKKNIHGMKPVLPLLMKLNPSYYHFNWQQQNEQQQIGLLAQEAYQLFPELVSYSKEKDLYKMNYAGFSTVAIKAIQEQQVIIQHQQQQIDELRILVHQLLKNK